MGYRRCYVTVCVDLDDNTENELTGNDVREFFENTLYDFPSTALSDGRYVVASASITDIEI